MSRFAVVLALGSASLLGACKPPPAPPPMPVFVRVLDEANVAVNGAQIAAGAQIITTTNPDGRAELNVGGREGATFFVDVRCPEGYRSPGAPLEIRRLENGGAAPEYVTRCNRVRHTLVVNVKMIGGGSMPVRHLGKEIARTDASGKARVVLDGEVMERIDLQLDTSDPAFAKHHPQNPTGSFEIPNRDDEVSFEVKFTQEAKPKPKAFVRPGPKQL